MKPIGYWLNRTDQALTDRMNTLLDEFGLTRVAWQVLNVIRDNPQVTDADVLTHLAVNASAIDTVLADGWATRPAPGLLTLTPEGRRRLATVGDRVEAFRALSIEGISTEEYRTAISVLERMTGNLLPKR